MRTGKSPVDPLTGGPLVLEGRIVALDAKGTVLKNGRLYIDKGSIVAVQDAAAPAPPGFATAATLLTKGTIYPGLIELHNHLAYNALQLWQVPKRYTNRDQWAGTPDYRRLVSGPMQIIGKSPDVIPALIRYVEVKTLLGGATTSQGIALFSDAGIRRFYRGIVRNVEETSEAELPEATTRIADVDAVDAATFLQRLKKQSCFLLHLSEGTDSKARAHFEALKIGSTSWAITSQLAGIHCAALTTADFGTYDKFGGAMVWSPFSNLLLYGATADVKAAKAAGVRIGIGADWSPSGSKNLLGELKVARCWNDINNVFSSAEILAMATRSAAAILQWDKLLGSLEAGKRADVLVVDGVAGDPYEHLFDTHETNIALVVINGVPRYGHATWMKQLGVNKEAITVGGQKQALNLAQATQDPLVGKLSLADAIGILSEALATLPKRAKALERPKPMVRLRATMDEPPVWQLALDELHHTGSEVRPRLPARSGHRRTGALALAGMGSEPLSAIVGPLTLDPLTVAGDPDFLHTVAKQKNLPAGFAGKLAQLY